MQISRCTGCQSRLSTVIMCWLLRLVSTTELLAAQVEHLDVRQELLEARIFETLPVEPRRAIFQHGRRAPDAFDLVGLDLLLPSGPAAKAHSPSRLRPSS